MIIVLLSNPKVKNFKAVSYWSTPGGQRLRAWLSYVGVDNFSLQYAAPHWYSKAAPPSSAIWLQERITEFPVIAVGPVPIAQMRKIKHPLFFEMPNPSPMNRRLESISDEHKLLFRLRKFVSSVLLESGASSGLQKTGGSNV
jgi:hypothetical protein